MNLDDHFVVLTTKFTDAFRRVSTIRAAENDILRVVCAALNGVNPTRGFDINSGRMKLFDVRLHGISGTCRIGMVFSSNIAPDGHKRVVFAVSFGHYEDRK